MQIQIALRQISCALVEAWHQLLVGFTDSQAWNFHPLSKFHDNEPLSWQLLSYLCGFVICLISSCIRWIWYVWIGKSATTCMCTIHMRYAFIRFVCAVPYFNYDWPISWLFLMVGHELAMVVHKLVMVGKMPTFGYASALGLYCFYLWNN